jgi:hypothetical protein
VGAAIELLAKRLLWIMYVNQRIRVRVVERLVELAKNVSRTNAYVNPQSRQLISFDGMPMLILIQIATIKSAL